MTEQTEQQPVPGPSIAEASDLHELDTAGLHFRREGVRLQMRRREEEWQEVSLARLFPLSDPEHWISVIDKDGKEIGILRELHGLVHAEAELIREEFHQRYLVPQIRRILACRDRFDLTEWTVETDRGEMTFLMRNPHDNIQALLPGRIALIDVEGNRYDIPDLAALDPASRLWVEQRL